MIELMDVCFGYGKKILFNDLCLKIQEGETTIITGANGSGKTTLALILAGIMKPLDGEIIIDGISSGEGEKFEEKRKNVGIVFANPDNQFITNSVERELAFGLENMGIQRKEIVERVERSIEEFSLEKLRFRSPYSLSGGEKQKVAIASIVVLKPKYIIFDDPLVYLDPASRRMIRKDIDELRKDISIIHISQFPFDIIKGDTVYGMKDGIITGPLDKQEFFRERTFRTPAVEFLNGLCKAGIYTRSDIPTEYVLSNIIEEKKGQRKSSHSSISGKHAGKDK
jgi:energy-coupling factor transport system ATP-binding protein